MLADATPHSSSSQKHCSYSSRNLNVRFPAAKMSHAASPKLGGMKARLLESNGKKAGLHLRGHIPIHTATPTLRMNSEPGDRSLSCQPPNFTHVASYNLLYQFGHYQSLNALRIKMTFSNTLCYQENEGAQENQLYPNDVLPKKKFPRGTAQKRKLEALQPLLPRTAPSTRPMDRQAMCFQGPSL